MQSAPRVRHISHFFGAPCRTEGRANATKTRDSKKSARTLKIPSLVFLRVGRVWTGQICMNSEPSANRRFVRMKLPSLNSRAAGCWIVSRCRSGQPFGLKGVSCCRSFCMFISRRAGRRPIYIRPSYFSRTRPGKRTFLLPQETLSVDEGTRCAVSKL